MAIAHVSHTRLKDYESCPRKAKLKYLDKIPEPVQQDSPLERGSRIHESIEHYITGQIDDLPEECEGAEPYASEFRLIRESEPKNLLQEQLWCFGAHWEPLDEYIAGRTRFLAKLDVIQFLEDGLEARIVDWKTGRKAGNEIAHGDQMMSYTLAAFAKYENLTHVAVMLRYTDVKEETVREFTRQQAMPFMQRLDTRIDRVLADREFYPDPSLNHCRYCPFKTGKLGKGKKAAEGTGHCDLNPE